jgi:hypothetical protein
MTTPRRPSTKTESACGRRAWHARRPRGRCSILRQTFPIEPGPRDAAQTVQDLLAVLDTDEIVHALDRMKQQKVARLVE